MRIIQPVQDFLRDQFLLMHSLKDGRSHPQIPCATFQLKDAPSQDYNPRDAESFPLDFFVMNICLQRTNNTGWRQCDERAKNSSLAHLAGGFAHMSWLSRYRALGDNASFYAPIKKFQWSVVSPSMLEETLSRDTCVDTEVFIIVHEQGILRGRAVRSGASADNCLDERCLLYAKIFAAQEDMKRVYPWSEKEIAQCLNTKTF